MTSQSQSALQQFKGVANQNIATASRMPRIYGRTVLASGLALTHDLRTLDYGFVETSKIGNRAFPTEGDWNIARAAPKHVGRNNTAADTPSRVFLSLQMAFRKVIGTSKLVELQGITGGICNGTERWVKPTATHTLFNAQGVPQCIRRAGKLLLQSKDGRLVLDKNEKAIEQEGSLDHHYSSEYVIVNGSISPVEESAQEQFCALGNSGS